jgi:hypothetical protein
MIITDSAMMKKMQRALKEAGDLFTLQDISAMLKKGTAQGHVVGDTWAITQVHEFPLKKSVNILVVVGDMKDSLALEAKIDTWARGIGADAITAVGRDGWDKFVAPGWKKTGTMYAKEL